MRAMSPSSKPEMQQQAWRGRRPCPQWPKRFRAVVRPLEGARMGSAGKSMLAGCLGIAGSLLLPAMALAQTFDIKQLDVTGGALEAASDNTVQGGVRRREDNRSAHELSLDYGVSNDWRLSGVLKFENPLQEDFRFARTSVENI